MNDDEGPVMSWFRLADGSLFTFGPRRITFGPVQADDDEYIHSWSVSETWPDDEKEF